MNNIVKTGESYKIFGQSIQTFNELPSGTYGIAFNSREGYSLFKRDDLEVGEKVYGDIDRRVKKILKSFENSNRNLGAILCGKKGSGKSMTARLLAKESKYPVIIVDQNTPGLSDFISSIKQEIIVLFDEFEKHFSTDNYDEDEIGSGGSPQSNLLSLFDGIDAGKKLFIITTNSRYKLNEFFLNRPGRFHYLFEYNSPSNEEIEEYLNDNLNDKSKVKDVLAYTGLVDFTYDALRAICFDINLGYSVEDTVVDLNLDVETRKYSVNVKFSDGSNYSAVIYCQPYSDGNESMSVYYGKDNEKRGHIYFNTKDVVIKEGQLTVPAADVEFSTGKKDPDDIEVASVTLTKHDSEDLGIAGAVRQMYMM